MKIISPYLPVKGFNNKAQSLKKTMLINKNGLFSSNYSNKAADLQENKETPVTNNFTSSRIVSKALPPAIKQWSNSIYSFNKNFTKALPVIDNLVNKLIKSFFTINPFHDNAFGKKLKLLQRRFKRLSLNKIFVSKPEIKHSNDKVFITVYLFNKRKKSLLYKLKSLYQNVTYKAKSLKLKPQLAAKNTKKTLNNKKALAKAIPQKARVFKANVNNNNKLQFNSNYNQESSLKIRKITANGKPLLKKIPKAIPLTREFSTSSNNAKASPKIIITNREKNHNQKPNYYNDQKEIRLSKRALAYLYLRNKNIQGNSNSLYRYIYIPKVKKSKKNKNIYNKNSGQGYFKKYNKINIISMKSSVLQYKKTSLLTKNKIHMFITKLNHLADSALAGNGLSQPVLVKSNGRLPIKLSVNNQKLTFGCLVIPSFSRISVKLKNYSSVLNKYKLYNGKFNTFVRSNSFDMITHGAGLNQDLLNYLSNNNLDKSQNTSVYNYIKQKGKVSLMASSKISDNLGISSLKKNSISNIIRYKGNKKTSLSKVNSLYKLFTLASNINHYSHLALLDRELYLNNNGERLPSAMENTVKKINLNSYKLLNKSFGYISKSRNNLLGQESRNPISLKLTNENINITVNKLLEKLAQQNPNLKFNAKKKHLTKLASKILYKKLETNPSKSKNIQILNKPISKFYSDFDRKKNNNFKLALSSLKNLKANRLSQRYIKRTLKNVLLLQKMNRINRFFKKYKNITQLSLQDKNTKHNDFNVKALEIAESNIVSNYKANYISEMFDKDLLYLYYVKMLTFNTSVFKNWFLNSLKNILSKIYNKKVILNLVNLKYIHLNSDIFTQAISIRLRNFRKNKLNKVLRKALKLVALSKINYSSYNVHSARYKYLVNYYNKAKTLHLDIFNDLKAIGNGFSLNSTNNSGNGRGLSSLELKDRVLSTTYSPLSIKGLSSVQSNLINFIKHKSVFGARLEVAGRLTKRSTASRAVFKMRYKGSLRNNVIINRGNSSTIIKNNRLSSVQFTRISSKTRNGSFGVKGWLNNL